MPGDTEIREERFQLLLDQIQLPEEPRKAYFSTGAIEKLTIHKQEKRWHFTLRLTTYVPAEVFQLLEGRMQETFREIAEVTLSVLYETPLDSTHIASYWPVITGRLQGLAPHARQRLNGTVPQAANGWITVHASNEAEAASLSRKLQEPLNEVLASLGFIKHQVQVTVQDENEEAREKFQEQIKQEDHSKMIEALMEKQKQQENDSQEAKNVPLEIGYPIKDEPLQLQEIVDEERRITAQGYVFEAETRELRSGRTLLTFKITDYTDSILVKMFSRDKEDVPQLEAVKKGMWLKVRGGIQNDTFVRDLVMIANDVQEIAPKNRVDEADDEQTRVELHLHSNMSQMDGIAGVGDYVKQAAEWGHPAVAVTDHGVAQAFPEAYNAAQKHGIKMLYGLEANLVDDGVPVAYNEADRSLKEDTFVVFDVETTGLSAVYDTIIELAAVKVKDGEIIDRFESFANPHEALSATIIELTGITDDMVKDAPEPKEVVRDFLHFSEGSILVAHNASFDMGFIHAACKAYELSEATHPVVDTLELGRLLYPKMKNHRLNTLCKAFDIELVSHHRAIYDAEATGYLLWKMVQDAEAAGMHTHVSLNSSMGEGDFHRVRPSHCTILAVTHEGLKNLYRLITMSHLHYFYRTPRIPRSELVKHRQGLLIGSGCEKGEVFEAMLQKSEEEAERAAEFYDFIEVQPPVVNQHLVEKEIARSEEALEEITLKLVQLGERLNKPVAATGNAHYVHPEDHIYRKVLIASQGGANPLNKQTLPPVHLRTTKEMLDAFHFLGEDQAKQVVVDTPRKIAEEAEDIQPIPDDLYTPNIEGADDEIRDMCYTKAKSIYGDPIPEIVEQRLERELTSIINNGFSVIYLISQKLVVKSLGDGYLVGSRGSVGSSFVATMMDITEVNPLPPHYVCPSCQHHEFFDDGSVASGYDLPDAACPSCEATMIADGHDIPFETFLGFKGDKVPDIDLNFSGEYQPIAHHYTKELFGEENVYRAGTIGTVAEKTAYGFVRGYQDDHELHLRGAEIDRLVSGCTGVKRTTGQHPGGIIVVPDDYDIHDFCPVQFPADDKTSEWKTTHFDFHSIHDNLLKLDILGHDDPTVIRMLQDLSGMDPKQIPVDDPEVMKIFEGPEVLGVTPDQILCKTGTYGIPEFGTRFVRQMLEETKPSTFSELVQISGLSHGADVWVGNAEELIRNGICELKDVIGCRDDIMVYLIYKGVEHSLAFKIMEYVRKGRGLADEWIEEMKNNGVPDWYIESCLKIKYMFPKAHAAAYVLMAVRIAYFKVHEPIMFYAAYFTVRADDFDLDTMQKGGTAIREKILDIQNKGFDASPKEKSLVTVLELALEMVERGYRFQSVDLYRSEANEFVVDGDTLIPPFNALDGVGTNAALNIVKARKDGEFLSKEDLQQRSKVTKTVLELLDTSGCLEGLPDSNQLSLF
ncbi:DNA polymerase III catalytic subunit PolC type [Salsuginibacillus halophilus]|uniref:DNA polymerase III PolC-type n=1 Tax=Salsuginibacillus halophilus TaxID=517424 RepID=A0A2P8HYB5_9BACI|nr:PolC-type DNA polymerase III [Salsuginibacillus halophilus]PSL51226.1 DNA polymerase III catalytic subunit PolC type [Salsuginibacillus halophilus]